MRSKRSVTLLRLMVLALFAGTLHAGLASAQDLKGQSTLPFGPRRGLATLPVGEHSLTPNKTGSKAATPQRSHDARLIEFDPSGTGTVSSPACAPSYCGTFAYANNNLGEIVGSYTDANAVPHGFLRTLDGRFISFDAPGAGLGADLFEGTVAYSINDLGVIAGNLEDPNLIYHGFVRLRDGSFASFDAPGAGTAANEGTFPSSINLEGAIAGSYVDENDVSHGCVRSPQGEITSFDPTGSIYTYPCEETCLNLEGTITGYYLDASYTFHGFLREPDGTITTVEVPGAMPGTFLNTLAASINQEGTITGYFWDSNNVYHGYVRTRDGHFTTFDAPGAATAAGEGTIAFSINLLGAVTGISIDANTTTHGFSRSARGTFATFDAPDAATGFYQGTRPSTNNLLEIRPGTWVLQPTVRVT
jgi:predicted membrane protein